MSIIVPDSMVPRLGKRGQDFATVNDARTIARQAIVEAYGPIASLLRAACDRIQVLEEQAGIYSPDLGLYPDDDSDATVDASCGDID